MFRKILILNDDSYANIKWEKQFYGCSQKSYELKGDQKGEMKRTEVITSLSNPLGLRRDLSPAGAIHRVSEVYSGYWY